MVKCESDKKTDRRHNTQQQKQEVNTLERFSWEKG